MLVSDASTLILLAKAEVLEAFLGSLERELAIDPVVEEECCGGKPTLDGLLIRRLIKERRIRVRIAKDRQILARIQEDFTLGPGEAATIALAVARKAALVLVDDKRGINACKLLKLPFATALTVLVRMHARGVLSREDARAKLDALAAHGRYASQLVRDAHRQLDG